MQADELTNEISVIEANIQDLQAKAETLKAFRRTLCVHPSILINEDYRHNIIRITCKVCGYHQNNIASFFGVMVTYDADLDCLLDIYVRNGVITEQEAMKAKHEKS